MPKLWCDVGSLRVYIKCTIKPKRGAQTIRDRNKVPGKALALMWESFWPIEKRMYLIPASVEALRRPKTFTWRSPEISYLLSFVTHMWWNLFNIFDFGFDMSITAMKKSLIFCFFMFSVTCIFPTFRILYHYCPSFHYFASVFFFLWPQLNNIWRIVCILQVILNFDKLPFWIFLKIQMYY